MTLDVNCPCGNLKKFKDCHGMAVPLPFVPPSDPASGSSGAPSLINPYPIAPQPVVLASQAISRKLDLAAGQNAREGFEGVDLWPGSQHVVDLSRYPWPFEDSSVLELHCSHYIEHIEMEYVDAKGNRVRGWQEGKEALLAFFDECFRILVPGGIMTVICPCARNDRAFQDPTHRRFIVAQSFLYLAADWRAMNKLDHYKVDCDFGINVVPIVPIEMTVIHAEAAARRMTGEWNTISDWQAVLQSKKALPGAPKAPPLPSS